MPTIGNRGKRLDLIIKRGATFAPHLVHMLGKVSQEPIDLTGAVIRAGVRKDQSAASFYPFTCAVVDALQGYFTFSMPKDVTAAIPYLGVHYEPANQYEWDLEIEFPSGFVMPVFYGIVKIVGEITQ